MEFKDRVRAISEFGFTERQARFLVTVMLHSGVCLLRQYSSFAGPKLLPWGRSRPDCRWPFCPALCYPDRVADRRQIRAQPPARTVA
jgi:hypothetical protein